MVVVVAVADAVYFFCLVSYESRICDVLVAFLALAAAAAVTPLVLLAVSL